jgi:hypothetical protein
MTMERIEHGDAVLAADPGSPFRVKERALVFAAAAAIAG